MDGKCLDGRNESTWEQTVVRGRINIADILTEAVLSQGSANVTEQKARHDLVSTPQLRICCGRQELDAVSSIGDLL